VKLSADEGILVEDTTMYKRIVGSLIYMTITRPDLSYVVQVVCESWIIIPQIVKLFFHSFP